MLDKKMGGECKCKLMAFEELLTQPMVGSHVGKSEEARAPDNCMKESLWIILYHIIVHTVSSYLSQTCAYFLSLCRQNVNIWQILCLTGHYCIPNAWHTVGVL